MGFKQHISRTWQMIEQQVNDVPFRSYYEGEKIVIKPIKIRENLSFSLFFIYIYLFCDIIIVRGG